MERLSRCVSFQYQLLLFNSKLFTKDEKLRNKSIAQLVLTAKIGTKLQLFQQPSRACKVFKLLQLGLLGLLRENKILVCSMRSSTGDRLLAQVKTQQNEVNS